jgi:hypothetical protein
MNNLIFFDKEGNSINFNYNNTLEKYEGDIIFHESSDDTYKTQALYLFENVNGFDYENIELLKLRKLQLFNEYGFHFYNSTYKNQKLNSIEPVNNDSEYFSKWLYGDLFDQKFTKGTLIKFEQNLFEFNNPNKFYPVLAVKENAILILSPTNNSDFTNQYDFNDLFNYNDIYISSVDSIGIYNYINSNTYADTLSKWNESNFYTQIYDNRKLNIVNSLNNDLYRNTTKNEDVTVVTIENSEIVDLEHWEYNLSNVNDSFIINVITRTDLPKIYQGNINFDSSTNKIFFSSQIPEILKPGVEFKIPNSVNNQQFLTVSDIQNFFSNSNLIQYNIGDQILWNNKIRECIQSYTWSAQSLINPDNTDYWGLPNYLKVNENIQNEFLFADIYLITDEFNFICEFNINSDITLASAAEKYKEELSILNVELFYVQFIGLQSDLIYPGKYSIVKYLDFNTKQNLGTEKKNI